MPPSTVYVGRGSKFGNKFTVEEHGRENAIDLYERHVLPGLPVHELRGKNLACWCPLESLCHGDSLLSKANA